MEFVELLAPANSNVNLEFSTVEYIDIILNNLKQSLEEEEEEEKEEESISITISNATATPTSRKRTDLESPISQNVNTLPDIEKAYRSQFKDEFNK